LLVVSQVAVQARPAAATKKKGILTPSPQWWRHLRDWKRVFWKKHRKAEQRMARHEEASQ
jgi:hypothetical protein